MNVHKRKVIYIRISTANQNVSRQLRKQFNADDIFIDVCSGSVKFEERKEAKRLIKEISTIGQIQVEHIDRLGRNLANVLNTLQMFTEQGVDLYIERFGLHTMVDGKTNAITTLIIQMFGAVAELERTNLIERTRQGVDIAKAKGKYKGKPLGAKNTHATMEKRYSKEIEQMNLYIKLCKDANKRIKWTEMATAMNVDRRTAKSLYELLLA